MTPTHFCDECRTRVYAPAGAPLCPRCSSRMLPVEFLRPVAGGQGRDDAEVRRDAMAWTAALLLILLVVAAVIAAAAHGGAS